MSTCMVVFSDAPRIGRALHFAVWVARSASTTWRAAIGSGCQRETRAAACADATAQPRLGNGFAGCCVYLALARVTGSVCSP